MYMYMYMYMYIYICVCMYVYVCVYIYVWKITHACHAMNLKFDSNHTYLTNAHILCFEGPEVFFKFLKKKKNKKVCLHSVRQFQFKYPLKKIRFKHIHFSCRGDMGYLSTKVSWGGPA
jgi:hypothetical protein